MSRLPKTSESITVIRTICLNAVKLVLDIGVQYKTGFLIDSCKDLNHILVEPCDIYKDSIAKNYEGIDHTLLEVAASKDDSIVYLVSCGNNPSAREKITHSFVSSSQSHLGPHIVRVKEIQAKSIDSILEHQHSLADNDVLLKIDVDGMEEYIIQGLTRHRTKIGVIIVEASLQSISQKIQLLSGKGFDLFDITDPGYYYEILSQVELVFINRELKNLFPFLDPWAARSGELHPEHWQHV